MATISIQYTNLNSAIQVGDHVFYVTTQDRGDFKLSKKFDDANGPTYVGVVKQINSGTTVVVTISDTDNVIPFGTDYFFFVKDNNVNDSGVLGYYSQVRIENDSTEKAELFAVGAEVFESSK